MAALVWFRRDLRIADNPALSAAAEAGPVLAAYVLDDEAAGLWKMGGAARWWLHHSLASLGRDLAARGVPLVLRRGPAAREIPRLVREAGLSAVHWNRRYEPWATRQDCALKEALTGQGVPVRSHAASLLFEPWEVKTQAGRSFSVFTPFQRAARSLPVLPPLPVPPELTGFRGTVSGDRLESWELLPKKPDWAREFPGVWTPGEEEARRRLDTFLRERLETYAEDRDRPGLEASSRLSPHLHWGEVGPRQAFQAARQASGAGAEKFLSELVWREFGHHLLFHRPTLPEENQKPAFDSFPWRDDPGALRAWQRGRTGFPLVDAGMRELWRTGWMHNRVRMVAASFLVKQLLVHWHHGQRWFWDTLVDADLASNTMNWQWVAGCGADSAPFFRIFNPVLQSEKWDPGGEYLRRWIPEIAALPDRHLHRPSETPPDVCRTTGFRPGETYPLPIVDLSEARARALAAYRSLA